MTTMNCVASSAPGPLASKAIGPFQFTPPDKFDGNKDNFKEIAFKLKAYSFLLNPGYVQTFK